jgi:hypothetical protein
MERIMLLGLKRNRVLRFKPNGSDSVFSFHSGWQ